MSDTAILNKVINLLSAMSDAEQIEADHDLLEDLGISSMDVLMLTASLEEEFKIRIPEKRLRKLVCVEDVADMIEELLN